MNEALLVSNMCSKLATIKQEFPYAHHGGCGHASLALWEALTNAGVEANMFALTSGFEGVIDTKGAQDLVDAGRTYYIPNGHIIVRAFGGWFDAFGKYNVSGSKVAGPYTPEIMQAMLEVRRMWNDHFWETHGKDAHEKVRARIFEVLEPVFNQPPLQLAWGGITNTLRQLL